MRYINGVVKEADTNIRCTHHWRIDSPEGPTSRGVCKLCGEEKDFYNWLGYIENDDQPNNP